MELTRLQAVVLQFTTYIPEHTQTKNAWQKIYHSSITITDPLYLFIVNIFIESTEWRRNIILILNEYNADINERINLTITRYILRRANTVVINFSKYVVEQ